MKQPQVVVVGHVCIDENRSEHDHYRSWGSSVMYIEAFYRKQLNIAASVITTYGSDFLIFARGIRLLPRQPKATQTLLFKNSMIDGKRMQSCEHADVPLPTELDSEMIQRLNEADICIVAPLLSDYTEKYVKDILTACKPDCVKVLGAQGYLRQLDSKFKVQPRVFKEAEVLLPLFDVVVLSDEDHPKARDMTHAWKLIDGVCNIVLTHGADGATIISRDRVIHIPTAPVSDTDIVDSVGCGDVFEGSLAYLYYQTKDLKLAIEGAHRAARAKLLASHADL